MVAVAQLVERRTVTPVVAGSIPVSHPILFLFSITCFMPSVYAGSPGQAQSGRQLETADADALIAKADAIIAAIDPDAALCSE